MMIIPFDDPDHPLQEPEFTSVDDVLNALVDGVDAGLAFALAEYAEGCVEDHHQRYLYLVRQPGCQDAANAQLERAKEWADTRAECLALYRSAARIRSN